MQLCVSLVVWLAFFQCCTTALLSRSCSVPMLKNGRAMLRQRGRLVRYTCYVGFELLGNRYSECEALQWDSPVPICIKSGCSRLERTDGDVSSIDRWASAYLTCQPGFEVAGSKAAFCDGADWDRTLGKCRETQVGPALWCDFEHEELCGWMSDKSHYFEWKRMNGADRTRGALRLRSGPAHDHTTMLSRDGHFMLTQSKGQHANDLAHLMSPLYRAQDSIDACFRFYYFMYGKSLGRLRVYLKPELVSMDEVLGDPSYILFDKAGNQENAWLEELFQLPQQEGEFQFIIQAMDGYSTASDIAIDDVALLSGAECRPTEPTVTGQWEIGAVFDQESCANRCNESRPFSPAIEEDTITNGTGRGGVLVRCDCFEGCDETCCPDYLNVCDSDEKIGVTTTEAIIVTEVKETESTVTRQSTTSTMTPIISTTAKTTQSTTNTTPTTTKATPTTSTTSTTSTTTSTTPTTTKRTRTSASTLKTTQTTRTSTSTIFPPTQLFTIQHPTSTTTAASPTATQTATTVITTSKIQPQSTVAPQPITTSNDFARYDERVQTRDSHDQLPRQSSTWMLQLILISIASVAALAFAAIVMRVYRVHRLAGNAMDEVRYLIDEEDVLL